MGWETADMLDRMRWRRRNRFRGSGGAEGTDGSAEPVDGRAGRADGAAETPRRLFLSEFLPGQKGRITAVGGNGPIGQRLLEMGLIEGTEIEVVRTAPLGDPIEVRIHGYLLSLRKAEARVVEMER